MRRLALVAVLAVLSVSVPTSPASAAGGSANGAGSTYVGLAMQQWVADGQTGGLNLNYTPTGSPDGLNRYAQNQIDFAGTEAEYSSITEQGEGSVPRGYQYIPDVAGATAIMYNLRDRAGNKVNYLHLSPRTIARIFIGDISNWSDPAISYENNGIVFPDKSINVLYRSGQSGTTALFYDFIQNTVPDLYAAWATRNGFPTNRRIVSLDNANFAPKTQGLGGSDAIAQTVSGGQGAFSIAYDEFGYARVYHAEVAWVRNTANNWVQPYAENISAALEGAALRADFSQELSGVYSNPNPLTYPISAYSYIVTQCAPSPDRSTCRGKYTDPAVADALSKWLTYIACGGQVNMASIGYSPLPPNLSQEIINSVGRINGTGPPVQLNASNCSNPRFKGSLGNGAASPPDPLAQLPGGVDAATKGGTNNPANNGSAGPQAAAPGAGQDPTAAGSTGAGLPSSATSDPAANPALKPATVADVRNPAARSIGGGSSIFRTSQPASYRRAGSGAPSPWLVGVLLLMVLVPPVVMATRRRSREPSRSL